MKNPKTKPKNSPPCPPTKETDQPSGLVWGKFRIATDVLLALFRVLLALIRAGS